MAGEPPKEEQAMVILTDAKYYVDTEEDDYEKGYLPNSYGASWDGTLPKRVYRSKDELLNDIRKADWLWEKLTDEDFNFCNGCLRWSAMADVENTPPDEQQLERWRKGEERLWCADGHLYLEVLPEEPHEMTDDEAKALGFNIW